jgi:hypothetical protein
MARSPTDTIRVLTLEEELDDLRHNYALAR